MSPCKKRRSKYEQLSPIIGAKPTRTNPKKTLLMSFRECDPNRYCFYELGKRELKELLLKIQLLESMTWAEAKTSKGLQIKVLKGITTDTHYSQEVKLQEIRITQKARIHGYHFENVFYIKWFDPYHEVTGN